MSKQAGSPAHDDDGEPSAVRSSSSSGETRGEERRSRSRSQAAPRREGGGIGNELGLRMGGGGRGRGIYMAAGNRAAAVPPVGSDRAGPGTMGRLPRPNTARPPVRAGPDTMAIGPCRVWAGPFPCRASGHPVGPVRIDIYNSEPVH